jgi:hypothetical protein
MPWYFSGATSAAGINLTPLCSWFGIVGLGLLALYMAYQLCKQFRD